MTQATRSLCETWGDWLSEFKWDHWLTLTLRPYEPPSVPGLGPAYRPISSGWPTPAYGRRAYDRYITDLSRRARQPVEWFRAYELGRGHDRPHFHALLSGTQTLPTDTIRLAWREGWARAEEYDPSLGATYYVTKSVGTEITDYDISAGLHRVRIVMAVPEHA